MVLLVEAFLKQSSGCGACTVMVSRFLRAEARVEHLRWEFGEAPDISSKKNLPKIIVFLLQRQCLSRSCCGDARPGSHHSWGETSASPEQDVYPPSFTERLLLLLKMSLPSFFYIWDYWETTAPPEYVSSVYFQALNPDCCSDSYDDSSVFCQFNLVLPS